MALAVLKCVSRQIVKKLNPFSGPRSLQAERQQRCREQFKVVVWAVLGANVVLVAGMLIQGCRREPAPTETSGGSAAEVRAADTNGTAMANQKPEGDAPVPPSFGPVPTVGAEPGTTISASAPAAADGTGSQPTATTSKAQARYVVKPGDSLGRIARTHRTTVQAIKTANGLTSDRIVAGQNLKLPESRTVGTSSARG